MKLRYFTQVLFIVLLLFATTVVLSSCGSPNKDNLAEEIILEPGLDNSVAEMSAQTDITEPAADSEQPIQSGDAFTDLERASTINDLMDNKNRINSYYFEQTIDASYGEIFIQTWYADGWMKIVSSFSDGEKNVEYFDTENFILVSHAPAAGDYGIMETFVPGDPDIPKNHLGNDYHNYRVVDTDIIDGQTCRVLESRLGEKLWVSTKHGFPLQVEFDDPTNDEHFLIVYENMTFNQVNFEEVAIPEDLEIIMY